MNKKEDDNGKKEGSKKEDDEDDTRDENNEKDAGRNVGEKNAEPGVLEISKIIKVFMFRGGSRDFERRGHFRSACKRGENFQRPHPLLIRNAHFNRKNKPGCSEG